ncbi:MAG: FKBP-type peptidyl-prolyl cis-trans isomerase [Chloroflexota bacterium]
MTEQKRIENGQAVLLAYTLYVDGEILDQSRPEQPLRFVQGLGQIIPGLERELYGMAVGESKTVTVAPRDGYGEINEEAYIEMPKDRFPPNVALEPGTQLQMRNPQGQVVGASIERVDGESVHLNLNHPLAGKTLRFEVQIAGIEAAASQ